MGLDHPAARLGLEPREQLLLGIVSQSTHGDSSPSGAGRDGVPCTRTRHTCCIQVVPLLDRVLTTTSPVRNGKRRQRSLSSSSET